MLTLEEASARLGVSHKIVRRLIDSQVIVATQVVALAPWEIPADSIQSERVRREVAAVKRGRRIREKRGVAELPLFARSGRKGEASGGPSAEISAADSQ